MSGNMAREASEVANRLVNNVTKRLNEEKETLKKMEKGSNDRQKQLKTLQEEVAKMRKFWEILNLVTYFKCDAP